MFGDGRKLAVADQERQDAIFRKLGLFNDTKVAEERKSDEDSNEKHSTS